MPDEIYELLDSGAGERLENFGGAITRRPAPMAIWRKQNPAEWKRADLIFRDREWTGTPPENWRVEFCPSSPDGCAEKFPPLRLRLSCGSGGQIGVFPEQFSNWQWLTEIVSAAKSPLKILNLFAHTGGATLACAAAGSQVCHVDASSRAVQIARFNAKISGLSSAPIRWLVDDCPKFVAREIRRQNFYDGIILDPPAFGRGGRGGKCEWKLSADLPLLLEKLAQIFSPSPRFILLVCHAPDYVADLPAFFPRLTKVEKVPLVISPHRHQQNRQNPAENFGELKSGFNLPLGTAWRGIF